MGASAYAASETPMREATSSAHDARSGPRTSCSVQLAGMHMHRNTTIEVRINGVNRLARAGKVLTASPHVT